MKTKSYAIFFALCVCVFILLLPSPVAVSASSAGDVFTIRYNSKQYTYSISKNEKKSSIHTIEHRFQRFGKKGTRTQRAELMQKVLDLGFSYEEAFTYVFNNFGSFADTIINGIARPKVNACINFNPNIKPMFNISREQDGYSVNKEEMYRDLIREYTRTGIINYVLKPKCKKADVEYSLLVKVQNLKSSFHTYYGSSSVDRRHNIERSLSAFNGLRLEPNVEYSFNTITGRRTEQNGYRKANIIMNDEYVEGFGGGVCQTSTTLYNALLLAGVEITEVRRHSLPSSYVALGFDAMVSYGTSDLKFVNKTNLPIFIRTYTTDTDLFVEVYGVPQNPEYKIKRVTEVIKRIPPKPEKVVVDKEGEYAHLVIYSDESAVLSYAKDGYEVNAYLEYYLGESLIERKLIRHERYKAQQGVSVVGAKARPKQPDVAELFSLT